MFGQHSTPSMFCTVAQQYQAALEVVSILGLFHVQSLVVFQPNSAADCRFLCGHVTESATLWCAAIGGGAASQYGKTPIRDELGLNDPDNLAIGSSKQAERARQARMNSELRSGLANLPKPQNEYEIRVPEAEEEGDEDMAEPMEEDAADVAARRQALQKAREEAELRKRSQVCCLHVE